MLKEIVILCLVAFAFGIPGGYETVEIDNEEVVTAANHAAEGLSKKFASKYHHRLVRVRKAEKQVVAGINFRLDIIVGETTCKTSEVSFEAANECEFRDNVSTYKKCTVVVYRDLNNKHKLVSSGCLLASRDEI